MARLSVGEVKHGTEPISALNTEVNQQVDGIAIVVPDQKIGPQVLGQAGSANIPMVTSDDPISDGSGKAAPCVGFDSVQMGTSVGQQAGKALQEGRLESLGHQGPHGLPTRPVRLPAT